MLKLYTELVNPRDLALLKTGKPWDAILAASHDKWAVAIYYAQGCDSRIHVGLVEEDGSVFSSRLGIGVYRQLNVDLTDKENCIVKELPWKDTAQAKANRDAKLGLPYDIIGASCSPMKRGIRIEPGWFCSHITRYSIIELTGAPTWLTELPDPACLDDEVNMALDTRRVSTMQQGPVDMRPLQCYLNQMAQAKKLQERWSESTLGEER